MKILLWAGGLLLFLGLAFLNQIVAALKHNKHQDSLVKRGVVQEVPLGIDIEALAVDHAQLEASYRRDDQGRLVKIWAAIATPLVMLLGGLAYGAWALYEKFR